LTPFGLAAPSPGGAADTSAPPAGSAAPQRPARPDGFADILRQFVGRHAPGLAPDDGSDGPPSTPTGRQRRPARADEDAPVDAQSLAWPVAAMATAPVAERGLDWVAGAWPPVPLPGAWPGDQPVPTETGGPPPDAAEPVPDHAAGRGGTRAWPAQRTSPALPEWRPPAPPGGTAGAAGRAGDPTLPAPVDSATGVARRPDDADASGLEEAAGAGQPAETWLKSATVHGASVAATPAVAGAVLRKDGELPATDVTPPRTPFVVPVDIHPPDHHPVDRHSAEHLSVERLSVDRHLEPAGVQPAASDGGTAPRHDAGATRALAAVLAPPAAVESSSAAPQPAVPKQARVSSPVVQAPGLAPGGTLFGPAPLPGVDREARPPAPEVAAEVAAVATVGSVPDGAPPEDEAAARPGSARVPAGPADVPSADVASLLVTREPTPPQVSATGGPPAPSWSPPPEADLQQQVVQSLWLRAREGGGEARVRLRPDYLGELTVRVSVHQGVVSARLEVETPAVREWVELHEASLRDALGDHGLTLESLRIEAPAAEESHGAEPDGHRREDEPERPRRPRRRASEQRPRFDVLA
jgi:flagellar hook-length control protein FliK